MTLAACCFATALAALVYAAASSFSALLVVTLLHSLAVAPTTNLADALALLPAKKQRFEYGWVRGTGSAAFIAASIFAGVAVSSIGLGVVAVLQSVLMLAVPLALWFVPPVSGSLASNERIDRESLRALLQLPVFRRVVLVAALVLGSHALHDTFSVIRWTNAGISPQAASVLWSLAVGSEVVVFFILGPWLLAWLGPAKAIGLAALMAAVR